MERGASLLSLLRACIAALAPPGAAAHPALWRLRLWDSATSTPLAVVAQVATSEAEPSGGGEDEDGVVVGEGDMMGLGAPLVSCAQLFFLPAAAGAPAAATQQQQQQQQQQHLTTPRGRPRMLALEHRASRALPCPPPS